MPDTEAPLRLAGGARERIVGSDDDRGILASLVATGGSWEAHVQRFMFDHVHAESVCLDVGANIGVHTVQLGRLAARGRVLAFEPGEENLAYLRRNLDAAGLDHVEPVAVGLYSHEGELSFVASRHHPGGSFIAANPVEIERGEVVGQVEVTTLDSFVLRESLSRIDFIKVDVEGSEIHFLEGAEETLRRHQPVMVMECNPIPLRRFQGSDAGDLFDALRSLYPNVGHVNAEGVPLAIHSRRELDHLVANHGLVDLVAGCEFPSNRRGTLRLAMQRLGHGLIATGPVVAAGARLRPTWAPTQRFVTAGTSSVTAAETVVTAAPGEALTVELTVRNREAIWLAGVSLDHPVGAAYRIRSESGEIMVDHGGFFPLPRPLGPGQRLSMPVTITAPSAPGQYEVELTLQQKGHVWFDQLDLAARHRLEIYVQATSA